jgi:hemerythrin-like metal-binding protein
MGLIHWDEAVFSIGIRKMDLQHEQLVGLVNALHAQKASQNADFFDRVFATLVIYSKQHFVDEEKILHKMHYPALESHHQQHLNFVVKLNELKLEYETHAFTQDVPEKLCQFLSHWLNHHILVEDKAYVEYLES